MNLFEFSPGSIFIQEYQRQWNCMALPMETHPGEGGTPRAAPGVKLIRPKMAHSHERFKTWIP